MSTNHDKYDVNQKHEISFKELFFARIRVAFLAFAKNGFEQMLLARLHSFVQYCEYIQLKICQ